MGTSPGAPQIEEAGLPTVELTIQVSVWAASNPDEDPGPLEEVRRQLSDRFDMVVYMGRPGSVDVVVKMLEGSDRARREEVDPRNYEAKNREFRQRAVEMASTYKVTEPPLLRSFIARLTLSTTWKASGLSKLFSRGQSCTASLRNTSR